MNIFRQHGRHPLHFSDKRKDVKFESNIGQVYRIEDVRHIRKQDQGSTNRGGRKQEHGERERK